jgi:uncharacterized membrane protein YkvA (DUF1232 family)
MLQMLNKQSGFVMNYKRYSETAFWEKVRLYATVAGQDVIKTALTLYYALNDEDTPKWPKTIIYSALIYFISPVDTIPDIIPGGYVDDLGTLLSAAALISLHIKEEHTEKAKIKVENWFNK